MHVGNPGNPGNPGSPGDPGEPGEPGQLAVESEQLAAELLRRRPG